MLKWSRNSQQPFSATASQDHVFNPDCPDKVTLNQKSTPDVSNCGKLRQAPRSSTAEVDHSCVRSQLELLQPDAGSTERCGVEGRRGSFRRWLVGSLRRVGKSRGWDENAAGGAWGSLRRSKSADRCGAVGGGLQPPSNDPTRPTQRSLLSLPEFAETAGVICQLLGNDPTDAPSLRSLVDAALNSPIAVESMLSWDSSSGYGSARDFPASP